MAAGGRRPLFEAPETEAVLAVGSLAIFGWALWAVLFNIIPGENEKYVMLLLGALIGVVKDTFGRYFQSTKGAQQQREDFAALAITAANSSTPPLQPPAPGTARVEAAPDVTVDVSHKPPPDEFEIPEPPAPGPPRPE
jgi:hypothetical protein